MKILCVTSLLTLLVCVGTAQDVELRFSAGKGIAKGGMLFSDGDEIYTSSSDLYSSSYTYTRTNVSDHYFSIGQGTRFEGSLILAVQKNIGLFLQTGYSSGNQSARSSYTSRYVYPDGSSSSSRYEDAEDVKFSYIPVITGFRVNFREGLFKPYGGAGVGVYLAPSITDHESSVYPSYGSMQPTTHYEHERKLTTNTPFGYVAFVGFDYALTGSLSLFAECKATLVSFYVTQSEVTMAKVDGVDQLGSLSRSEKVTVYEEDHNFTTTNGSSENEPSFGGAPWPIPGNSIGITFGISIAL